MTDATACRISFTLEVRNRNDSPEANPGHQCHSGLSKISYGVHKRRPAQHTFREAFLSCRSPTGDNDLFFQNFSHTATKLTFAACGELRPSSFLMCAGLRKGLLCDATCTKPIDLFMPFHLDRLRSNYSVQCWGRPACSENILFFAAFIVLILNAVFLFTMSFSIYVLRAEITIKRTCREVLKFRHGPR